MHSIAISPILVPYGTFDIPVTCPTLPSLHVLHRPAPTVAPISFSTSPVPTSVRRSLRSLALGQRHAAPRVLSVVTRGQRAGGSSTFHRPTAFGRRHGLRLRSIPDETAKQVKAPSLVKRRTDLREGKEGRWEGGDRKGIERQASRECSANPDIIFNCTIVNRDGEANGAVFAWHQDQVREKFRGGSAKSAGDLMPLDSHVHVCSDIPRTHCLIFNRGGQCLTDSCSPLPLPRPTGHSKRRISEP